MIVVDTRLSRICGSYCKNYELLMNLLEQAERNINYSRHGSPEESLTEKWTLSLHNVKYGFTDNVALDLKIGEHRIIRREETVSNLNLEFINWKSEKWIPQVDKMMLKVIIEVFTSGMFGFSRQIIKNGIFEATDVDTL